MLGRWRRRLGRRSLGLARLGRWALDDVALVRGRALHVVLADGLLRALDALALRRRRPLGLRRHALRLRALLAFLPLRALLMFHRTAA